MIVGYSRYLTLISDLIEGKEVVGSGMRQETDRCRYALDRASEGAIVSLVSSGDSGIYGMAGLVLELIEKEQIDLAVEIIPGVTAATAAAARLGAPLMLDYATISLSDLLVPWDRIAERLTSVAAADLVVALYNPRSKGRIRQLEEAAMIFKKHRAGTTPVGIVSQAGLQEERIVLSDLAHFLAQEIDMRTIVIIGNSCSRLSGYWFITPRGYSI